MIDRESLFDEFLKQKCYKINLRLYKLPQMRKFVTYTYKANTYTLYKKVILPLFDSRSADSLSKEAQCIIVGDTFHERLFFFLNSLFRLHIQYVLPAVRNLL